MLSGPRCKRVLLKITQNVISIFEKPQNVKRTDVGSHHEHIIIVHYYRSILCVDITISHADSVLEDVEKVGEFRNSVHAFQFINQAFC